MVGIFRSVPLGNEAISEFCGGWGSDRADGDPLHVEYLTGVG